MIVQILLLRFMILTVGILQMASGQNIAFSAKLVLLRMLLESKKVNVHQNVKIVNLGNSVTMENVLTDV